MDVVILVIDIGKVPSKNRPKKNLLLKIEKEKY